MEQEICVSSGVIVSDLLPLQSSPSSQQMLPPVSVVRDMDDQSPYPSGAWHDHTFPTSETKAHRPP